MIFMLDGAVNNEIFSWMKNFVRNFAGQLNVDNGEYRIGAMTFARRPSVQFHLNKFNFQDEVSLDLDISIFFFHSKILHNHFDIHVYLKSKEEKHRDNKINFFLRK